MFKRAVFMTAVMVLAAAAGSAGVLAWRTFNPPPATLTPDLPRLPPPRTEAAIPGLKVGDRRPDFSLADTDGTSRSIAEWDGKLLIVNFWATWCPPCLEEIPVFVRLQEEFGQQGVQFLGVALDRVDNVRQFMADQSVNYPSLHGEREAIDVGRRYGNELGALPYTVLVSRHGEVLDMHHGQINEGEARALIESNLR